MIDTSVVPSSPVFPAVGTPSASHMLRGRRMRDRSLSEREKTVGMAAERHRWWGPWRAWAATQNHGWERRTRVLFFPEAEPFAYLRTEDQRRCLGLSDYILAMPVLMIMACATLAGYEMNLEEVGAL